MGGHYGCVCHQFDSGPRPCPVRRLRLLRAAAQSGEQDSKYSWSPEALPFRNAIPDPPMANHTKVPADAAMQVGKEEAAGGHD